DSEEDSSETDSEDDSEEHGAAVEDDFNLTDYDYLPVSSEIKELFEYIKRYTPKTVDIEHKLQPFIPDFIPAVGDIDAFLKVPRPDGKPDNLGLLVLDEPSTKQSDPTVLSLWLTENSKQHNITQQIKVKSLENAEKNPKAIDNWIESISELHRCKPPATVHYSRPMPDIEALMQEWSPEFEELLGKAGLPTAEMSCDLPEYIDMVCGKRGSAAGTGLATLGTGSAPSSEAPSPRAPAVSMGRGQLRQTLSVAPLSLAAILDIPVYKSRIQPLHVLFSLYSEFKNSQVCSSGQAPLTPLRSLGPALLCWAVCEGLAGPKGHFLRSSFPGTSVFPTEPLTCLGAAIPPCSTAQPKLRKLFPAKPGRRLSPQLAAPRLCPNALFPLQHFKPLAEGKKGRSPPSNTPSRAAEAEVLSFT
uniref:Intraflagellar transport protein 46 homolog n=1 Tax=Strix occidentalis caurina TaxID=311401 RepID=A0A8D0EFQ5_STROC